MSRPPLYTPNEQSIVDCINQVPDGYITTQGSIAAALAGKPGDTTHRGAANVYKSLRNLGGRCTAPIHRVLMQDPEQKRRIRLIVRDPAHIALLLGEGVNVDARGVLLSLDRFWDFTPRCVLEYDNQRAAAAAVVVPSDADSDLSSLPDEEMPDASETVIYSSAEPKHEGHKAAQEIAGDGTVVEPHVDCSRAPQAERGVSVEKSCTDDDLTDDSGESYTDEDDPDYVDQSEDSSEDDPDFRSLKIDDEDLSEGCVTGNTEDEGEEIIWV